MAKPGFRLAVVATLLGVLVVLLGAYTRVTHAGLGCPDWPGCFGFISVPSSEAQLAHAQLNFPEDPVVSHLGWSEMIHRYAAGGLTLLILALAAQAFLRRRRPDQPVMLPLAILAMVLAQAAFGMWTVTLKLWPQVVTAHLLGGFTLLSLMFLLALRLSGACPALGLPAPGLKRWALIGLLAVAIQIALGGWVSTNYAALACLDLPTCQGQWWPQADFAAGFNFAQHIGPNYLGGHLDSEARTAIHLTHRLGAVLVSLTLAALALRLWTNGLRGLAAGLLAALAVQLGIGLANIALHLPVMLAVAHNAGGVVLLLTLVLVNQRLGAWPGRLPVLAQLPLGSRLMYRDALPVAELMSLNDQSPENRIRPASRGRLDRWPDREPRAERASSE